MPNMTLAALLESNRLWVRAKGGGRAKLYAPEPFVPGSSISHFDESTYPPGSPDSLMTPTVRHGEVGAGIGRLFLCVLEQIGWRTDAGCMRPMPTAPPDRPSSAPTAPTTEALEGFGSVGAGCCRAEAGGRGTFTVHWDVADLESCAALCTGLCTGVVGNMGTHIPTPFTLSTTRFDVPECLQTVSGPPFSPPHNPHSFPHRPPPLSFPHWIFLHSPPVAIRVRGRPIWCRR